MARYRIAVDTGGTFTDLLAFDTKTKALIPAKVPSTPTAPQRAVIAAYERTEIAPNDVEFFAQSSTVALNTLLQRRGAPTGLLTTAGFRDVLEIGRFNRPEMYDLMYSKPPQLVPRNRRIEVSERITCDGVVLTPLDEKQCLDAVETLVAMGTRSLAICFLNAYRNPEHERRAATIVRARFPELRVVASHELAREWREYERSSTTVMNAYVTPSSEQYLAELDTFLNESAIEPPLLVTRSDGGLMGVSNAALAPITTLMAGPAAGIRAAALWGVKAGHRDLITMDIGGTSCDIGLVLDGEPLITHERSVEGYPVLGSMVDASSIGAGGGTIAWVDDTGSLKVGPHSAGAEPGPACYARGGDEPTVTDAYLVLGLLDAESFLGGEMALDVERARRAIARLAKKIRVNERACALGIVRILEAQMAGALRVASIERGHDPRDFALLAYGGAGGMHAGALAKELGVPTVIIPRYPAHLSPLGILAGDLRQSFARTDGRLLSELGDGSLSEDFDALRTLSTQRLAAEGFDPNKIRFDASLELRYVGQLHTAEIPCNLSPTAKDLARTASSFHRAFHQTYGYQRPESPVQLVTLRLEATGKLKKPDVARIASPKSGRAKTSSRRVWLSPKRPSIVPVYERARLSPGARVRGPALIEESASVTLVHRGQSLEVNPHGMLLIRQDRSQ